MLSYMVLLVLAVTGRLPFEAVFAAIAAQSIANVDVRGAYTLRFTLLLAKSAVLGRQRRRAGRPGGPRRWRSRCWRQRGGGRRHGTVAAPQQRLWALARGVVLPGVLHRPRAAGRPHRGERARAGRPGRRSLGRPLLQVALWAHPAPTSPARRRRGQLGSPPPSSFSAVTPPAVNPAYGPAPRTRPLTTEARHSAIAAREATLRSVTLDQAYLVLSAAATTRSSVLVSQLEHLNFCVRPSRDAGERLQFRPGSARSRSSGFASLAPSFLPVRHRPEQHRPLGGPRRRFLRQPGHLADGRGGACSG